MPSKKFILVSPKNRTVWNFRGDLIKAIMAKGYEVVVTGPDRIDVDRIEALGARFVEIPVNKTGTSIKGDLKYYKALKTLFLKEKPDVVLSYTVKAVIYGSLAASAAGVPNINAMITGGGYTFIATSLKARILGFIVRTLYKRALSKVHRVIFQNPDDLREFCDSGLVSETKCHVVNGSGVNMERFTSEPLPAQPTFFMLSRLLRSKGVMEYLQAAKVVKEKHPEARFCLLGKFETAMQDAIPQEEIMPYLESGIVERFEETNDVRPYYAQCSVYVLPSYREGTPRTVLEAMAMGRPIITTDTNGCRETVENGKNGFLVPVKSVDALVTAMTNFIDNSSLVESMGKTSRTLAEEKYDVRKVNAEILKITEI